MDIKGNKTILVFVSVAVLLASAACQKSMDIQRDDRAEDMRSVYERLARVYEHLRYSFATPVETGPSSGFTAGGYMMSGYCDEAQEVNQSSCVYDWYRGSVSSSSMPLWKNGDGSGTDRWDGLFNTVRNCNEALRWLDDPSLQPDYEEEQRVRMISQFYALRAYAYLQLIKRYGGVPIIETPTDKDYPYSEDKRASFAQCVDFIIETCDLALAADPSLPWFNGPVSYSNPELCKGAIWAMKSQAALYAASPLWAEDYAGTEKYTWARAAQITKEALDLNIANGAALVDENTTFPNSSDFGENAYDKYFLSSYPWSLAWDTETLYQPYNYGAKQSIVWQYAGLPIDVGQVSAGACPTQEMVDAYEVLNAAGTRAVPLLDLSDPYNEDGSPNFNPEALSPEFGYEDCTEAMYRNRDPRFYASIYYDGTVLDEITDDGGNAYVVETFENGNCGINLSPTNIKNTCTGYYLRKFSNAQSGADAGNMDGYMRTFRLAELYLNFAEAAFNDGGADREYPATEYTIVDEDGNTVTELAGSPMTAREAVNAVRSRVGMPGIEDNGEDFRLRMYNERRVELAFEEHRFFDVRRWSAPDDDLSSTDRRVSGMRITVGEDGKKAYERFNFDRRCYENKYLKYPLNIDEVRKMLSLTGENWQNGGWN